MHKSMDNERPKKVLDVVRRLKHSEGSSCRIMRKYRESGNLTANVYLRNWRKRLRRYLGAKRNHAPTVEAQGTQPSRQALAEVQVIPCSAHQSQHRPGAPAADSLGPGPGGCSPNRPPVSQGAPELQTPAATELARCPALDDICSTKSSSPPPTSSQNANSWLKLIHSQGGKVLTTSPENQVLAVSQLQDPDWQNRWHKVSLIMWDMYHHQQQPVEIVQKKFLLHGTLEKHIRGDKRLAECKLYVFGSSVSGFGTVESDMDLCLTHHSISCEGYGDESKEKSTWFLRKVRKMLEMCSTVKQLLLVPAKIPILRFFDTVANCEVDLNFNNTIGIRNTHLLRTYANSNLKVDWRLQPLVMTVKCWAKGKGINNAKTGTLSSYSLTLMVIHYLQHGVSPPVLPSLQKLRPEWFPSKGELDDLRHFTDEELEPLRCKGSEKQTLGELLAGFLLYFSEFLKQSRLAISVRLGSTIEMKECREYVSTSNLPSHWKYVGIEEPFTRGNVARSCCDPKTLKMIIDVFRRSTAALHQSNDLLSDNNVDRFTAICPIVGHEHAGNLPSFCSADGNALGLDACLLDERHDAQLNPKDKRSDQVLVSIAGLSVAQCTEPSPCICNPDYLIVSCDLVSAEDIRQAFSNASVSQWREFHWTVPTATGDGGVTVPADLLGSVGFERILMTCRNSSIRLSIHADAFRASSSAAQYFDLSHCDLALQVDYSFLHDFHKLTQLFIDDSHNVPSFTRLPSSLEQVSMILFNANSVRTNDSDGTIGELSYPKLRELYYLNEANLDDADVERVIEAIRANGALTSLGLLGDQLTRIPRQIPRAFPELMYLDLSNNGIETLAVDSVAFSPSTRVTHLYLTRNRLTTIESGAFRGDFSGAYIDLRANQLIQFESSVFQTMLEAMAASEYPGSVSISENPFDCDGCGLSWLIRGNRELLRFVKGGTCSNMTAFRDLNPDGYSFCDHSSSPASSEYFTEPTTDVTNTGSRATATSVHGALFVFWLARSVFM